MHICFYLGVFINFKNFVCIAIYKIYLLIPCEHTFRSKDSSKFQDIQKMEKMPMHSGCWSYGKTIRKNITSNVVKIWFAACWLFLQILCKKSSCLSVRYVTTLLVVFSKISRLLVCALGSDFKDLTLFAMQLCNSVECFCCCLFVSVYANVF